MKKLVDTAKISVHAGNGGDGSGSFRHEKYIPKGGPDGGDGGKGGSVYILGDPNMSTLMDFRSRPMYAAENGAKGMGKKMFGKDGSDLIIKVPLGTLVYWETAKEQQKPKPKEKEQEQEQENVQEHEQERQKKKLQQEPILIADIVIPNEPMLVAQGGKGGLGNVHFKSSTNRTPKEFTPGIKGESKDLILEIKLLADVGLVGMPNAGKSTLINSLTGTNSKIGNYPFTTITPNLGPLKLKNGQSVIIADIPGLIEGASEGKGLGDDFLRHIERTRLIVHMIDPISKGTETIEDISDTDLLVKNSLDSYKVIKAELLGYSESLGVKPEIVVINKIDITEVQLAFEDIKEAFSEKLGIEVLGISAFTGEGSEELVNKITFIIDKNPNKVIFEATEVPAKIYTPDNLPNRRIIQTSAKLDIV